MKNQKALHIKDLILVFVLLFVSGNFLVREMTPYLYVILLIGLVLINPFIRFSKSLIFILVSVVIIFILQRFTLGFISLPAALNYVSKILLGYMIVKSINDRFPFVYLKVMYYLSLISLFIFVIFLITNYIPTLIKFDRYNSVIIYNHIVHNNVFITRNSGMFWEPGAFQGYLNLVPLFFLDKIGDLWNNNKKECIVILITILSTQSTTGYLVLFLVILYHITFIAKKRNIFYIILALSLCLYVFINTNFMRDKIFEQYEEVISLDIEGGQISWNRMGAALTDWYYIKKHPIIGNGFHEKTRWSDHSFMQSDALKGFGNGFTGIIHTMGSVFIIIYFILLYKNLPFRSMDKMWFVFIIIILLQGEDYLMYPFFLSLPFVKFGNRQFCKNGGIYA